MMHEDNHYFVGVANPKALRKNLLLCTKDLITGLKTVEVIRNISAERTREVAFLKQNIAELNTILKKLKKALPKTKIPGFPVRKSRQTALSTPSPRRPRPVSNRSNAKLDRLEAEIAKIESKLDDLE